MTKLHAFIISALVLVGSAIPALAEGLSKQSMRDLVKAEDIAGVEDALHNAQRLYIAGETSADDMREVYGTFTTSDPQMIAFTKDWVEQRPNSVFAHTARAWVFHNAAFRVRGGAVAGLTPRPLLDRFHDMEDIAAEHASKAYALNPDFIPASDAIIIIGTITDVGIPNFEALNHVMETAPNWGTLERALFLTNKGWGGSLDMQIGMCDQFGPMVPTDGPDMVARCKIVGGWTYYMETWRAIVQIIFDTDDPYLDDYKAKAAQYDGLVDDEHTEFLLGYFDRQSVDTASDVFFLRDLIRNFDDNKANRASVPLIWARFRDQFITYAEAEIEYDPYNPKLISILQYAHNEPNKGAGFIQFSPAADRAAPDIETNIEFARRRLVVKPYTAQLWFDYADAIERSGNPDHFYDGEPYRIEGIIRSNYDVKMLYRYMIRLAERDRKLRRAKARDGEAFVDFANSTDRMSNVYCPFLQVYLLHQYQCSRGFTGSSCTSSPFQKDFDRMYTLATKGNICEDLADSPIRRLVFKQEDLLSQLGPAPLP